MYALDQYKKSGISYPLNYALRNNIELTEQEADLVRCIDTALDKLPEYTGTVYRSISAGSLDDMEVFEKELQSSDIVMYHAYTSASSDGPYDPSMEYQFIIQSKHGKDMRKYNPLEMEIIFRRGTRFWIKKREGNTFYLEEL